MKRYERCRVCGKKGVSIQYYPFKAKTKNTALALTKHAVNIAELFLSSMINHPEEARMICLELRKRNPQHCGCRPVAGVEFCAFLRGRTCLVEQHNSAVMQAFNAGLAREPLPEHLKPANYLLPH